MNSPDERREAAMLEATRSWHEIALHRKPAIAEERRHFFDAGAAYAAAKGGVIAAIARYKPIPLRFIGVGEALEDLQPFNAEEFVDALLG